MRLLLACLLLVSTASTAARADDHAAIALIPQRDDAALASARRLRGAGVAVLVAGVVATIVGQVLIAEGVSWEIGNGLGEHYDPTPAWVPTYETAGWVLFAGGQAAVISGISMLAVGDARRDRARLRVGFSLAPSPTGGMASLVARF